MSGIYHIRDFGAMAQELCTTYIQSAIDTCAASGGGTVVVSDGTYVTGTIFMKSNVHLRIEGGARLLMSGNIEDFPDFACEWDVREAPRFSARCMIYIGNCENVSVEGLGTIDCNASAYCEENPTPCVSEDDPFLVQRMKRKYEAKDSIGRMIFVMKSKNVTLSDFTMTEMAGGWGIWINASEFVNVRALKLYCCPNYPNSDGIHINCSRDVFVSDCAVHSGDDSLIIRANTNTLGEDIPCENVVVRGCTFSSHCQAIRIGWLGDGEIKNCIVSDVVITDSRDAITIALPQCSAPGDVGKNTPRIERLSFNNIVIDRTCRYPVNISIAEAEETKCGYIRNLRFTAFNSRTGYFPMLVGREKNYLEDITFDRCRFEITERADKGFMPRYVRNLKMDCEWHVK
jgi:polygalacturonase